MRNLIGLPVFPSQFTWRIVHKLVGVALIMFPLFFQTYSGLRLSNRVYWRPIWQRGLGTCQIFFWARNLPGLSFNLHRVIEWLCTKIRTDLHFCISETIWSKTSFGKVHFSQSHDSHYRQVHSLTRVMISI